SSELSNHLLESRYLLSESLIDYGVGDSKPIDDQLHTGLEGLELVVPAKRVDLLGAAPQQDEAAGISTGRVEEGDVEALDFSVLLKTSVILQRLVEEVEGGLLAPAHRSSKTQI